jgi:hypothetical protein
MLHIKGLKIDIDFHVVPIFCKLDARLRDAHGSPKLV